MQAIESSWATFVQAYRKKYPQHSLTEKDLSLREVRRKTREWSATIMVTIGCTDALLALGASAPNLESLKPRLSDGVLRHSGH
jgi:hypothetical protein